MHTNCVTANLDCGHEKKTDENGVVTYSVSKAFSIVANAAVPYHTNDYYYETEVLADPTGTRHVLIVASLTYS